MPTKDEQKNKLLQLIRDAAEKDAQLRAHFQIGDKFKFIRERIHALLNRVEESLQELEVDDQNKNATLAEDETLVYVYLFNAQGLVFKSWQKFLTPSIFYEHSVNRPIYTDKNSVEAFIRSKSSKPLHGIITVAIKNENILPVPVGITPPKDAIGGSLVKVKEGSLKFERMVSFVHVEKEYIVTDSGEIVLKNS